MRDKVISDWPGQNLMGVARLNERFHVVKAHMNTRELGVHVTSKFILRLIFNRGITNLCRASSRKSKVCLQNCVRNSRLIFVRRINREKKK